GTLRARMGAAAVAAGRAIGYQNAGTVEFVVDTGGKFYFLEVNTRLQVEHPVTEEITGLDLVRLQILIAQGARLPLQQEDLAIRGHAIECRIYAEDPHNDFLPSTGTLVHWETPELAGVRYESGVETGSEVTIYYDPMLAKVIAHARTRVEAAQRLARALGAMRTHGVRTNVALLIEVLRHPAFIAGQLDTHFIGTHVTLDARRSPAEHEADRLHALATALWLQARRRAHAPVLQGLPSGWRNNPTQMQQVAFALGQATISVSYRVARDCIEVAIDGATDTAVVLSWDEGHIALAVGRIARTYRLITRQDTHYVHSTLGTSDLHEVPRFPPPAREEIHGGCRAPMPGKILAIRVDAGQAVHKGETLVILEAMQMEHEVTAPHDGVVREVLVQMEQQVDADAVLVILEEAKDD
ncbi:MAG: biotin/lipoyl-containing protein, partial [Gaiellaceae bacterium]